MKNNLSRVFVSVAHSILSHKFDRKINSHSKTVVYEIAMTSSHHHCTNQFSIGPQ